MDDVLKVGEKIQVEIREVDDRGKLSLVPVEVLEQEASGGDGDGQPGQDTPGPAGQGHRDGSGEDGHEDNREGSREGHHRTRHRTRRPRES